MPAQSRTLFWQLGLAFLTLQVILAVAVGAYALNRLRHFHQEQTIAALDRVTPLARDRVSGRLEDERALRAETEAIASETGLRVTVVRADGLVLADSERDPAGMDEHRYRQEIDTALRTGSGSAVRYSATLGLDMVYVAHVLRAPAGGPVAVVRTALPLTAVNAELTRALQVMGVAALGSFLIMLAVIYVVSRRLDVAVDRLVSDARRLAAGDLKHRISRPRTRELALLATALDDMARRLGDQIDRLQTQRAEQNAIIESMSSGMIALDLEQRALSINRSAERMLAIAGKEARGRLLQELVREPELNRFVETSLAGASRLEAELALRGGAARIHATSEPLLDADGRTAGLLLLIDDITQLRQLESIRSDFAANVSHELRTPITNIKGYVETMLDVDCGDAGRTREFLQVIGRNAKRLEAIVEDLLSLARIEGPEPRDALVRTPVPAGPLIDAAVAQVDQAAREKRIAIDRHVEDEGEGGLTVSGVHQLLEQAIANLLANAVNYSAEQTRIRVTARARDEETVEIAVSDEGPGIAARHLPRIFERFYRVDRARSRDLGGTGLGLAIVKHIALVHGGRAEVESTVGVAACSGSCFHVREQADRDERVDEGCEGVIAA